MYTKCWWKKNYESRPVGRPKHKWKIILKCILKKWEDMASINPRQVRMVGFCEFNFGFRKFRGISRLAEKLLASSERLYSMELVTLRFLLFCACYLYGVSQEERAKLRESVPYVKLYRYNPKHLYPKLNGYGDNGKRSLKLW